MGKDSKYSDKADKYAGMAGTALGSGSKIAGGISKIFGAFGKDMLEEEDKSKTPFYDAEPDRKLMFDNLPKVNIVPKAD